MASQLLIRVMRLWLLVSTVVFTVLAGSAIAQIENSATAQARYGAQPVASIQSVQAVPVTEGEGKVQLTKVIDRVEDVNNNAVTDAGDIVHYAFELRNVGNVTISRVAVTDNVANIPVTTAGPIAPNGVNRTLTATYTLTQLDIDAGGFENSAIAQADLVPKGDGSMRAPVTDVSDAGDEAVETPDLAGDRDGDPTNDPTVLLVDQVFDLDLAKEFVAAEFVFPYTYDFTYRFTLTNTGTTTGRDLQVQDDLFNQFDRAQVVSARVTTFQGFSGLGSFNPQYDGNIGGAGSARLLTDDVQLGPGETGIIEIVSRVALSPDQNVGGIFAFANVANVTANGLASAVSSYDPNAEAGQSTGATLAELSDLDGDGAFDTIESNTADRDGDGIVDAADYDPTGYFYCEETGTILSGGRIRVFDQNGSSANVIIVEDGTSGFYQWFVSHPGTYTMVYDLPPGGIASESRLVSPQPLVLSTLSGNPAVIGSGEVGGTGQLADFSAAANPFFDTFVIAASDPNVFNVNIPLQFCGTPVLTAQKTVIEDPVLQADGRFRLTYQLAIGNKGSGAVHGVSLRDDLGAVFGSGRVEVASIKISDAPEDFAADVNESFDGTSDREVLTDGGILESGDTVTVDLSVIVDPRESGTYTNTIEVTGFSPLDGSPVEAASASVDIDLVVVDLADVLKITKAANPSRARVGDAVTFTLTVENTADFEISGLTLIDALPQGLAYRDGSGSLRGRANEPSVAGRTLSWDLTKIADGETVVATLRTVVTSRAEVGVMVNQAWVADAEDNSRITDIAEATVELIVEAIFNCSDVIGSVFEDRNMNGFQDGAPDIRAWITDQSYRADKVDVEEEPQVEGAEPGLPDVRLVTPTGTVITTDDFGRYSVPCAELPKRAGSNFTLKLDVRSLPNGYRVTTENPRTMRVTPGIFTEMNFGAAAGRVIDLDLTAAAFDANGQPSAALRAGLAQLLRQVIDTPSILRLTYYREGEGSDVARARLDTAETMISGLWEDIGSYELIIERNVAQFE